jgi:hypothetical protein
MRELTLHEEPAEAVLAPIASGLRRYNEAHAGGYGRRALAVTASGGDGDAVIAGAHGMVQWGWLYVERLWVSEERRGGGPGGALLDGLERPRRSGAAGGRCCCPPPGRRRGSTASGATRRPRASRWRSRRAEPRRRTSW